MSMVEKCPRCRGPVATLGPTSSVNLTALPIASALNLPKHLERLVDFVKDEIDRDLLHRCGPCNKALSGRVWNIHNNRPAPLGSIVVMRPSRWGNPYVLDTHGDRFTVLKKHREWLRKNPSLVQQARRELAGKILVCCCFDLPCHADTLAWVADGGEL